MYAKISYEIILQTKFTESIIIHIIYGVHVYNVVELQMPWLLCLLHTIFDVHIYNVVELHMPRLLCLLQGRIQGGGGGAPGAPPLKLDFFFPPP